MIMYAIDSKGKLYNEADEPDIYSVLSANKRVESLQNVTAELVEPLLDSGLNIDEETKETAFTYLFQPFGLHDSIVVFVRTPLSSSCNEVKIAYYMRTDKAKAKLIRSNISNGLKTDFTDDMLLSIFYMKVRGKITWYLLNVLVIDIERNAYDGAIISLKARPPVSYRTFANTFSSKILKPQKGTNPKTKENLNKYLVYSPAGCNIFEEKEVFDAALITIDDEFFDKAQNGIADTVKDKMTELDEYSNIKCSCINFIASNPVDKIYPIYIILKKILFKTFEGISSVMYKGSKIFFTLKDYGRQCIYVCDKDKTLDAEKVYYMLNGHAYHGLSELEKALSEYEKTNCFQPVPWFIVSGKTDIDIITYYFHGNF